MATAAAIRQRVYDYLYGQFPNESPFVTTLTATYTDAEGVIDVLDGTQWAINDVLENSATDEQMKVLSISANILTVVHGWNGTTTAAAVASDDVLFKNPRFTAKAIDQAVAATMQTFEAWGIHIFNTGTITRADPKTFYELADTDIIDHLGVLRMFVVYANSEVTQPLTFRYQFQVGTDTAEYSQGRGVHLAHFGDTADGDAEIVYIYAQRIGATTDLLARQEELTVIGAVANMMGHTITPATHDPGARSDRTTAPGQTARDVRYFQGRFITEARQEAAILTVERQKQITEGAMNTRARRWVN